ncbi:Eukaryotic translation initiation factor 2A [Toxocara canis]|uniref:Eukaryotic translation initiation factor 2A n=1 Tax=Toxocara canis TaxID=6265 RepID=A0A0B2VUB3_TOXCA|nr:Eukaryotic translation initiation factor 2A [Toxocara canis]
MGDNLLFAVRGSEGFSVRRGITSPQAIFEKNDNPKANPCRVFQFSNNGQYFCYCDSSRTVLVESTTGKEIFNVDLPRTQQILFSPKDRLLATFEPYAIYGSKTTETGEIRQPAPNLRLWNLPGGSHLTTLIAQKQNSWKIQWTDDEVYSVRLVGSELLVHKYNSFEKYESKLVIPKVDGYALSPGSEPHHLAAYIPPSGGQPAVVQLRRLDHKFTTVANKTFFKCDKASLLWNCKGSALVVLASLDVDQSNKSYYGEQNLYLVAINGDSCMVSLAKSGPVYSVKWNPNGKEFAVCYGFMPAHVTLYNLKGEATFDLGEGPRNDVFYNRFGNILLVCGFGNIAAGKMEFWNVDEHKEIIRIEVPNTTHLEWAPDGQHLMTATTTPRLRMDNGYRIWHYSGRLIYENLYEYPTELWQVQWRPISEGVYNRFHVSTLTAEEKCNAGLRIRHKNAPEHPANNLPAGAITKRGAYVPPHLRNATGSNKGALNPNPNVVKPAMTETEKKMRNLQKKLDDIAKLKKRKENGEALEANQLLKIDKENELMEELEKLKV